MEVIRAGVIHAIAFWFQLDMADGVHVCSDKDSRARGGHWLQALQRLNEEVTVQAGDTIMVNATVSADGIDFTVRGGLLKNCFAKNSELGNRRSENCFKTTSSFRLVNE